MAKVAPCYSKLETDRKVYHDNDKCQTRDNIQPENRVPGTGGRPKCQECAKLP
jgi:hypothetical protein